MTLKAREETRVSSTPVTSDLVADRGTSLENPADRSASPHTTSRSCKHTETWAKAAAGQRSSWPHTGHIAPKVYRTKLSAKAI